MPKKPKYCKNLRSKKKWVEDFEKANNLLKNLQMAYDFYKEGELLKKN
jgi:peptide chain release factor 2